MLQSEINTHLSSVGVQTTGYEPKYTFRFALAGTNTVGIVRVLCKKNREKGPLRRCHFCRNEAVIVGSAAFFTPVSSARCGHPTVAASEFCVSILLNSQETCLCTRQDACFCIDCAHRTLAVRVRFHHTRVGTLVERWHICRKFQLSDCAHVVGRNTRGTNLSI